MTAVKAHSERDSIFLHLLIGLVILNIIFLRNYKESQTNPILVKSSNTMRLFNFRLRVSRFYSTIKFSALHDVLSAIIHGFGSFVLSSA